MRKTFRHVRSYRFYKNKVKQQRLYDKHRKILTRMKRMLSEKFNKFVQYAVKKIQFQQRRGNLWEWNCTQVKREKERASFRQVVKSFLLMLLKALPIPWRRKKEMKSISGGVAKVFIVSLFEYIIFSHFTIVMENPCWQWMQRERGIVER